MQFNEEVFRKDSTTEDLELSTRSTSSESSESSESSTSSTNRKRERDSVDNSSGKRNSVERSNSTEEISSENSSSEEGIFSPNEEERQVIRQSLAMICRSNRSDWIQVYSDSDTMILREACMLYVDGMAYPYEIRLEVSYNNENTVCNIGYFNQNFPKSVQRIRTEWNSYNEFDRSIIISRDFSQTYCFFFSQTVTRTYVTLSSRDEPWCDFISARNHLYSISNF